MKILIETYRGWEIKFDTETESFFALSDMYDTQTTKNSFASIKKFIDEYIKENANFKPFWAVCIPNHYYVETKRIKIIGIRKDGLFMYENEEGKKLQLSKYNEEDYMIEKPENEQHLAELKKLQEEEKQFTETIRRKKEEIKTKLVVEGLKTIKLRYQ